MSVVCGLFRILYVMCDVMLCSISYAVATFMFAYLLAIKVIVFIKPELS